MNGTHRWGGDTRRGSRPELHRAIGLDQEVVPNFRRDAPGSPQAGLSPCETHQSPFVRAMGFAKAQPLRADLPGASISRTSRVPPLAPRAPDRPRPQIPARSCCSSMTKRESRPSQPRHIASVISARRDCRCASAGRARGRGHWRATRPCGELEREAGGSYFSGRN